MNIKTEHYATTKEMKIELTREIKKQKTCWWVVVNGSVVRVVKTKKQSRKIAFKLLQQ